MAAVLSEPNASQLYLPVECLYVWKEQVNIHTQWTAETSWYLLQIGDTDIRVKLFDYLFMITVYYHVLRKQDEWKHNY